MSKFNEYVDLVNLEDNEVTVADLRYFLFSIERAFDAQDVESDWDILVSLDFFNLENCSEIAHLKDTIKECHDVLMGNIISFLRFDYSLITITVWEDRIQFHGTENKDYHDELDYKDLTLETATNLYIKSFAVDWG